MRDHPEVIYDFNVEEVLNAYIEAALWSTNDESTPSGGEPLDRNYSAEDLNDGTRDFMCADVVRFLEGADPRDLASYASMRHTREYSAADLLGHDFWLSRNGHGAGFFDRTELQCDENANGTLAERLQAHAKRFGECNLYVGDDGQIYAC